MRRATVLLVVMLCLAWGMLGVASAQDEGLSDDENALLDVVNESLLNIIGQEWVHQTVSQVVEQTIGVSGISIDQTLTTEGEGDTHYSEDGDVIALTATTSQSLDQSMMGSASFTLEVIYADDTLYIRATDSTGLYAGLYPSEWTNLSAGESFGGMEQMLDMDSYINQIIGDTYFKIVYDGSMVDSVNRLDSVEIDGMTLDGYELVINSERFFSSDQAQNVLSTFDFGSMAGMVSEEEIQKFMEDLFRGMEMTITFYIEPETRIPYQMDMDMIFDGGLTLMGQAMSMRMDSSVTSTLSYGETVTIEAPR